MMDNPVLDVYEAFVLARRKYFQGTITYTEAVAAAEAYRAAIESKRKADPRFRRLAVPSVAKLMRG